MLCDCTSIWWASDCAADEPGNAQVELQGLLDLEFHQSFYLSASDHMSRTFDRFAMPSRQFIAVLGFAFTLVIAGGCSSKPALTPEQQAQADLQEYEVQIRKVVSDPARADKLVSLTNEFQKLSQDTFAHINSYRAKVAALNSSYEATRADYENLFKQQDAERDAFVLKATTLREQMAALTTDAEWAELKKARLHALDADLQELLS